MKEQLKKIEELNGIIDSRKDNCRTELKKLCAVVCKVCNFSTLHLERLSFDTYNKVILYDSEEGDFYRVKVDGYGGWFDYIDGYWDKTNIYTKKLDVYIKLIREQVEAKLRLKEKELKTIEEFERFIENFKKAEEAI